MSCILSIAFHTTLLGDGRQSRYFVEVVVAAGIRAPL